MCLNHVYIEIAFNPKYFFVVSDNAQKVFHSHYTSFCSAYIVYICLYMFIELSYQSWNRQSLWTLEKLLPVTFGHFEDCSSQLYLQNEMTLTNNKEKIRNLYHFT